MKVTFDLPNNTVCTYVNIMVDTESGLIAHTEIFNDDTVKDGAVIDIAHKLGEIITEENV